VQARSNFTARTVTKELQADCFAGAWSKHPKDDKVFDVSSADLDSAFAGILDVRDTPGTSNIDGAGVAVQRRGGRSHRRRGAVRHRSSTVCHTTSRTTGRRSAPRSPRGSRGGP
jgi:hypothetical protein